MESDTVPCKFCRKPTKMEGTMMCDNCWEVDKRIDEFVESWEGLKRVLRALKKEAKRGAKEFTEMLTEFVEGE